MTEGRRDPRALALARVRAVEEAYDGSPQTVATQAGAVEIVDLTTDGEAVTVTVTGAEGGDPLFRIFNPPNLVPDPTGDREINGIRFRYDPLAAVAHVIAEHGGAQDKAKDARRGRR
jgi:hypothetical protein